MVTVLWFLWLRSLGLLSVSCALCTAKVKAGGSSEAQLGQASPPTAAPGCRQHAVASPSLRDGGPWPTGCGPDTGPSPRGPHSTACCRCYTLTRGRCAHAVMYSPHLCCILCVQKQVTDTQHRKARFQGLLNSLPG